MPERKAPAGKAAPSGAVTDSAELLALRDELDRLKRDLVAANGRVRELEESRRDALERIDAVIKSIAAEVEK